MLDKLKKTISDAGGAIKEQAGNMSDAIKEQASNVTDALKEKTYLLIEDWGPQTADFFKRISLHSGALTSNKGVLCFTSTHKPA